MGSRSTNALWSGLFRIAPGNGQTLQSQIRQAVVGAILNGQMPESHPLPSCRTLAKHVGVARGTVVLAYQQLVDQGFLIARERHGHFVNPEALPTRPRGHGLGDEPGADADVARPDWDRIAGRALEGLRTPEKPRDWLNYRYPFVYGQFDPNLFPTNEWRECSRMALGVREIRDWASDWLEHDDPLLIEQIRSRILPRRGVFAREDEVLVTLGAQNGLFMLASLLIRAGDAVGVENPGYPDARHIFAMRTERVLPVPVDGHGLDPDLIPPECRIVFATPTNHCPTSATMPPARCEALLEWAERNDGLVIEDDYDSQIVDGMSGATTPALKALDRTGRVIFVGSLSKSLAPGLRLGFLVADAALIRQLRHLRRLMLRHPPANNQRAVATFLSLGHHDALVRRLGQSIRSKRETLRAALQMHMPWLDPGGATSGTALWLRGPEGFDADTLVARARERSIIIEPGRVFFSKAGGVPRDAIRMGVTSIEERNIEKGVRLLAEVADELDASRGGWSERARTSGSIETAVPQ